jgi:SAM-dependent methyltransferase
MKTESTADVPPFRRAAVDLQHVAQEVGGFKSLYAGPVEAAPDTTTPVYAKAQVEVNAAKVIEYLLPRVKALGSRSVLDVGCGVGAMVKTFLGEGYESYGVDLPGLHTYWTQLGLSPDAMFIVSPDELRLPFHDGAIDFAYTFGVIEHVGTTDGGADRRADYHQRRRQWLREIFRVVRPGGAMLIAGPNRGFPIDVAHGPDSRAGGIERWVSNKLGVSFHKTWGDHFLWAYEDFANYLDGLPYRLDPQTVEGFLAFSRVPAIARPLVQAYVDNLPKALQGTGFNPWVMGMVHKAAV